MFKSRILLMAPESHFSHASLVLPGREAGAIRIDHKKLFLIRTLIMDEALNLNSLREQ